MKMVLFLVSLLIFSASFSQNLLSFQHGNCMGFINMQGDTIIEAQYEFTSQFSEGLASVGIKHKVGYIDTLGRITIEPKYNNAALFKNGVAVVCVGDKRDYYGLIDTLGNYVIDPIYDWISFQGEGKIGVKLNNLWGFFTINGVQLTEIKYAFISAFSEDMASVQCAYNGKYGFIDPSGELKTPFNYNIIFSSFNSGLAAVSDSTRKNIFINKNGENAFDEDFHSVGRFNAGKAFVKKKNYESGYYIDTLGNRTSDNTYRNGWRFTEGLCGVRTDSSFAIINHNEEIIYNSKDIELRFYANGFGFFCDQSGETLTWGLMNENQEIISDKRFVSVFSLPDKDCVEFYLGDPKEWYGYAKEDILIWKER